MHRAKYGKFGLPHERSARFVVHKRNTRRDQAKWTLDEETNELLPESMAAVDPVGSPQMEIMKSQHGRW
jgi:hypothetical protein